MMNTAAPVRLRRSISRTERSHLRHAWGNSKLTRWLVSGPQEPFGEYVCLCHGLVWDLSDEAFGSTCPLVRAGDTGELTPRQVRLVLGA